MGGDLVACLRLRAELVALLREELAPDGIRLEPWPLDDLRVERAALRERLARERPSALVSALLFPFAEHLALLREAARAAAGGAMPLVVLVNNAAGLTRGVPAAEYVRLLTPPYEVRGLSREIRDAVAAGRR
jgi:hypothetical protein